VRAMLSSGQATTAARAAAANAGRRHVSAGQGTASHYEAPPESPAAGLPGLPHVQAIWCRLQHQVTGCGCAAPPLGMMGLAPLLQRLAVHISVMLRYVALRFTQETGPSMTES
jgi:hypothetical protein